MSSNNYGGRQPNNTSYIKQFFTSSSIALNISGVANWIYRPYNGTTSIIPVNSNVDVIIPKDLIVNGSILNPSDRNLKNNITNLDSDFCKNILNLTPYSFTYKNDPLNETHYGFMAQDIPISDLIKTTIIKNPINCECEKTSDIDSSETTLEDLEIKHVKYTEMIPLLVGVIKHMNNDIIDLKTKLSHLENSQTPQTLQLI